ncbi:hypothetical protein ASPZODRAFT_63745, partial [Penicilliopsis zonata CBS 506.65]
VQLSRRQGAYLSCTARSSPVPLALLSYTSRRGFRSSPCTCDLSDSGGGKKFGGARWGSKASKPATLSAAELALRDSLVTANKAQQQAATPSESSGSRWGNGRSKAPALSAAELTSREALLSSLRPRADHSKGTNQIPARLRALDWTCPDCRTSCFGKHSHCPSCNLLRPELEPSQLRKKVTEPSEQSLRIRRVKSEKTPRQDNYNNRDKEYGLRQDRFDGRGKGREPANERVDNAAAAAAASAADTARGKSATETWSWDISSLDKLNLDEDKSRLEWEAERKKDRKPRGRENDDEEYDPEERRQRKQKRKDKGHRQPAESTPNPLYLPEFISVSNLADVIGVRPAQFIERMEEMGFEGVTYSHILDAETAGLVATEYNFDPIFDTAADDDLVAAPEPENKAELPSRPPVVTIMGHVDHGKTTILDWLRKSSIAASEHGGITQHIGAFTVPMPSGKTITFLDTPGHAAFLEMRRRGADVTDIVVLVVAADDSVKPQTIEAIKHATGAKVPVIVAISKIDKENVKPERVKQDLAVHGIHVEDYGGDVQAIPVSGKTGQGMLELEEAIVALSEMLDHRADTEGNAEGWVIEASTKSYGRTATVLVRRGTMRVGDIIVAGTTWARIRTLRNEAGVSIEEATPGMPVEIDGWKDQPEAGTEIIEAPTEQRAKDVVDYRLEKSETQKLGEDMLAINDARRELMEKRRQEEEKDDETPKAAEEQASGPKPIHFIIKADVGGSAEAVLNSVTAVGNNEVFANILRTGVGPVSEFDIEHAASANGHVINFNMPVDTAMRRMAETRGLRILDHNIIYKLVDDVKETLSEHLAPNVTQRVTGEAEVGQIFEITLKRREKTLIAGCKVRNGTIQKAKKVRVIRGEKTIYDGSITSLKNVKKDVTEMRKDTECGISFEGFTDFAVGDHIQCYEEIFEKRTL